MAHGQAHGWSRSFGGTSNDYGESVARDAAGNLVVTGYFRNTADFGGGALTSAGDYDVFLAKYDAAGNHVWSKRFGDVNPNEGYDVAIDPAGNIALIGSFAGTVNFGGTGLVAQVKDVFVASFDANGNHRWSKRFGGTNFDHGASIDADASGAVAITGRFRNTVDFGGGPLTAAGSNYDIFVAKLDANGTHVFSRRFGNAGYDEGNAVACDGSGNIIVTGRFQISTNFGGGLLISAGNDDMFLAKYDGAGSHIWSARYGTADWSEGKGVDTDGDDNVLVSGIFGDTIDMGGGVLPSNGGYDIVVAKFTPNGIHAWSRRYGSVFDDLVTDLAADGYATLTGMFYGTIDFGGGPLTAIGNDQDAFSACLDASGGHCWSRRYGGTGSDGGSGVACDPLGNTYLTGFFANSIDFGGGTLTGAGVTDGFVVRLLPLGISGVSVTSTFNSAAYTWDATVTFHTNLPSVPQVQFDPSMACFPACAYTQVRTGPAATDHSVALTGLAASNSYCFRISAQSAGSSPGCQQAEVFGSFALDNAYANIYAVSGTFLSAYCKIRVTWKSKFPSTGNTLYWRPLGGSSWNAVAANGDDCAADRSYVANFFVSPASDYQYKVATTIDGVAYESSVYVKHSGRCDDPPDPQGKWEDGGITRFELQAHPNPFNPKTTVILTTPMAGEVVVKVYSATGRYVTTLASGWFEPGVHRLEWRGVTQNGAPVASGTYYARMEAGDQMLTSKLMLLR